MLCPSCRQLISVSAPACPHCGAARPGLFGYGPALSRLLGELDPVRVIPIVCIVLYVIALAMEQWNLHRRIALWIIRVVGSGPTRLVLSFMIAVGKPTKPAWPRGERLPDSEVVIHDKW